MKHKILIVEDEKGIRETLNIFLKNQGYEILEAKNGQEGLDIIENNDASYGWYYNDNEIKRKL